MKKKIISLTLTVLMLLLTVTIASAADHNLGLGVYGGIANYGSLSLNYRASNTMAVQGLVNTYYLGAKAMFDLEKDPNYNFYGFGKAGFNFNKGLDIGAGAGIEYFLFKALNISDIKELHRIGLMLDLGISFQAYETVESKSAIKIGLGSGIHYYF